MIIHYCDICKEEIENPFYFLETHKSYIRDDEGMSYISKFSVKHKKCICENCYKPIEKILEED